ncbi:hypothetical protein NQZ68_008789, partial [Dissostichus eleginoides]
CESRFYASELQICSCSVRSESSSRGTGRVVCDISYLQFLIPSFCNYSTWSSCQSQLFIFTLTVFTPVLSLTFYPPHPHCLSSVHPHHPICLPSTHHCLPSSASLCTSHIVLLTLTAPPPHPQCIPRPAPRHSPLQWELPVSSNSSQQTSSNIIIIIFFFFLLFFFF